MKEISNFTSAFNINKTSSYHLALEISQFGYSYSIIDQIRRQYVALKHVPFKQKLNDKQFYDKIKESISTDTFLSKNYKSMDLIYVSRKSTLVPTPFFDRSTLKQLVDLNFELEEYEEIHFNKLKNPDTYNVFTIPSYITTLMVNTFPEVRFFHQSTALIESSLTEMQGNTAFRLFINVSFDFVDVLGIEGDKLIFHNTNFYKEASDVVYIIANILKQQNLKAIDTEIELSGDLDQESAIYKASANFFPKLSFFTLGNKMMYPFKEVPEHQFRNILILPECE